MLCRIILVRHRFRAAKGRSMKFRELKKSLAEGVKPIYLITGEDSFFIERSIALICNACLAQPDLNLTRFDGKEIKGETEKLVSALLSYPFMSEKRVVLVKEYYPLAQDLKKLASYFSSPCDTTVFLIADSSPCEGIAKQSNVTVVDCAKGEISLLAGWIRARAGKDGVSFDDRAIGLLIDYCQSDMTRIAGETRKTFLCSVRKRRNTAFSKPSILSPSADTKRHTRRSPECSKRETDRNFSLRYTIISEGCFTFPFQKRRTRNLRDISK